MIYNERRVAGGIIINAKKELFLGESPKWNGWIIPAGGVEDGETDEEAYIREMKEELNIQVKIIQKVRETTKEPGADFLLTPTKFHFIDYLAYADENELKHLIVNDEFTSYGWFSIEEALQKQMVDTTRHLVELCIPLIERLDIQLLN